MTMTERQRERELFVQHLLLHLYREVPKHVDKHSLRNKSRLSADLGL